MSASTAFTEQLAAYKRSINEDIARYAAYARKSARTQFGEYAGLEVDTFLDMLERGGKRIRGALVMHAYHMCGGTNQAMILQAARAIEMLHAYMLILDDVQDRSVLRRGKPATHMQFAAYHREHHYKGDADHTGISLAINAAIAGCHAAQMVLANMDADPQLKLNALSITNRTLAITAHGQTYDVMNAIVDEPNVANIERVMEWKTALYSFINPLHVGMVLAGAGCHDTDDITPYGLHAGKAFQITDDILGLFGSEQELGKSPLDDMREGKQTILTVYTLAHAPARDAAFVRRMLGNANITTAEFTRCQNIIQASGALDHARHLVQNETAAALQALDTAAHRWPPADVRFLRDLAAAMVGRTK